ncbi:MAG: MFS transporter, partial [Pseudomonadota bacterium]
VAAVPGSMFGGVIDDLLGPKPTVILAVGGLLVAAVGVVSVSPDRVFFFIAVDPPADGGGPFAGRAEQVFLAFGLLAGLCVGPAQAASRTLMASLAPRGMVTEFFGLYALSGKATAFLAPLLIGIVTAASGAQRPGILVLVVLMALGLALLLTVRVERAQLTPAPEATNNR